MGQRSRSLHVTVLHNSDYQPAAAASPSSSPPPLEQPGFESGADVENVARNVVASLRASGHRARAVGIDARDLFATITALAADPPDLIFNLCESLGRDPRHEVVVPSLLDLVGLPYTGSGPLALGLSLRKDRAKDVLRACGVPTPASVTITTHDLSAVDDKLPFPLIVKPTREDASIGIDNGSVVHDRAGLERAVHRVLDGLHQPALVEQYIEGREMYVSLLGNAPPEALPFHEIDFADLPAGLPRIVSYSAKWDAASPEFIGTRPVRCVLDDATRLRVERAARAAFAALELRDYARVDVRLSTDGTPYVIDVNPNCDLSDSAGFARAAGFAGLSHPALVERVCLAALERATHVQDARPRPPLHLASDAIVVASGPPDRAKRSRAAVTTDRQGRPVLVGRGEDRARADRRRAR